MSESTLKDRKELIDSAVSFLKEASVNNAPLEKKIEFLKSKGLNDDELELALNSVQKHKVEESAYQRDQPNYTYEALPPPLPQRDWRDYFIMATATAGLFYGAYEVTRRFIIPNVLPESKSKLEQDKKEIELQLQKVDQLLLIIKEEQAMYKEKEESRMNELDETIYKMRETIDQTTRIKDKLESEFSRLKLEMNSLQTAFDKFVSNNGNSNNMEQVLREIESLKTLMNSVSKASRDAHITKSSNKNSKAIGSKTLPGVEAVPSASELLAKLNLQNSSEDKKEESPDWTETMQNNFDAEAKTAVPQW